MRPRAGTLLPTGASSLCQGALQARRQGGERAGCQGGVPAPACSAPRRGQCQARDLMGKASGFEGEGSTGGHEPEEEAGQPLPALSPAAGRGRGHPPRLRALRLGSAASGTSSAVRGDRGPAPATLRSLSPAPGPGCPCPAAPSGVAHSSPLQAACPVHPAWKSTCSPAPPASPCLVSFLLNTRHRLTACMTLHFCG